MVAKCAKEHKSKPASMGVGNYEIVVIINFVMILFTKVVIAQHFAVRKVYHFFLL